MKTLTLIILFITTLSSATTKDTIQPKTPTLDKTEQLIDKYGTKIADTFISTMESAKPIAKEGFEAVVWLQIAHGVACLLPLLFMILFLYKLSNEYSRIETILNSDKVPNHMDKRYGVFGDCNISYKIIMYLAASIILFLVALFTTYSGITHLIAPKWYAIKEIIELIK